MCITVAVLLLSQFVLGYYEWLFSNFILFTSHKKAIQCLGIKPVEIPAEVKDMYT